MCIRDRIWKDQAYSYQWFLQEIEQCRENLNEHSFIKPGKVVALYADFSPRSLAYFLALIEQQCVLVPLTESVRHNKDEFYAIAEVQVEIALDGNDHVSITNFERSVSNEVTRKLVDCHHPGLILFSSGSTGKSKAALHDLVPLRCV